MQLVCNKTLTKGRRLRYLNDMGIVDSLKSDFLPLNYEIYGKVEKIFVISRVFFTRSDIRVHRKKAAGLSLRT